MRAQLFPAMFVSSLLVASGLALAQEQPAAAHGSDPLLFVVSLNDQKLQAWRGNAMIAETKISSGKPGHSTPTGVFSVLHKTKFHRSNLYSNAPMPWMQRLTWTGVALHQGVVPDYPASHGCIRLPEDLAENLYSMSAPGVHVAVNPEVIAPRAISHPLLPQPYKAEIGMRLDRSMGYPVVEPSSLWKEASSGKPLRMLITRGENSALASDVQSGLKQLGYYTDKVDGLVGEATMSALRMFQEVHGLPANGNLTPQTVTALFKTLGKVPPANGRLYVRQGFEPLFDVPIHIKSGQMPFGTHLFTMFGTDLAQGKTGWQVLTLENSLGKYTRAVHGIDPDASEKTTAESILDRVEISPQTAEKISRLLTPGSSIATSDTGFGPYTGWNTDFVVSTRSAEKAELVASANGNLKPVKRRSDVVRRNGGDLVVIEGRVHMREVRPRWLQPLDPMKGFLQRKVTGVRPVLKRIQNPRIKPL